MGGSNTKAGIRIQIEQQQVSVGSQIVGMIHIQTQQTVQADSLVFRFKGTEKFDYSKGANRSRRQNYIVNRQNCLHTFQNELVQTGQYSFPFSFQIPEDLPGSFSLENVGSISYKIKVFISFHNKKLAKDSIQIVLTQKYTQEVQSIYQNLQFPIQSCMSNYGQTLFGCWLSKNVFFPSENGQLVVQIDNSGCRRGIVFIELLFKRLVVLKGKHTPILIGEVIYQDRDNRGVRAGISLMSEAALDQPLPFDAFKEKIMKAATTNGNIIQCRYTVELRFNYGRCVDQKSIEIDLAFYPEKEIERRFPQAPEDWNPIEMPQNNFSLVDLSDYEPSAPLPENQDIYEQK